MLGGAPTFYGFLELFRPLQDPIITQLLDRQDFGHALTLVPELLRLTFRPPQNYLEFQWPLAGLFHMIYYTSW